jgi:methylenetetrahydrofolate reductase (NADPH)
VTKISELLKRQKTFSFEFYPPKNESEHLMLSKSLRELEPLEPSFVSVTYRGGRSSRQPTYDLVVGLLKTTTLTPMAHLICVAHSRLELAEILVSFRKAGIENLMALGGDPPKPGEEGVQELAHAIELVELARSIGGFSIGVAAHPLGHPRSPSLEFDRKYLFDKLQLADFAITQFFFEVTDYLSLVDDLDKLGNSKPIIPGIMPVTSVNQIEKMAIMGAAVPDYMANSLMDTFKEASDEKLAKKNVRKLGIEYASRLCRQLLDKECPGLHFYTLNQSSATREIYNSLGLKVT